MKEKGNEWKTIIVMKEKGFKERKDKLWKEITFEKNISKHQTIVKRSKRNRKKNWEKIGNYRKQKSEGNKWISKRKCEKQWEENRKIEDVIEKANYRCKIEEKK